jgi:hypothetical protein
VGLGTVETLGVIVVMIVAYRASGRLARARTPEERPPPVQGRNRPT